MNKLLRKMWLMISSLERRLFLLNEYFDLKTKKSGFPPKTIRKILKSPSSIEDYINISRFLTTKDEIFLIDVGANTGHWMKDFLEFFPKSKCLGIEPSRDNFSYLLKAFKHKENVKLHNTAASNFSGEKVLNIKSDGTLNSFEEYLEVFAENRQEEFVQRETVKVDLIDNLIDFSTLNGETKVVIKIDVQGHEIEALNGASKVLDYTDLVLCEMSFINEYVSKEPSFSEVCSILRKHKIYPLVFQEYGKQLSNHIIECDVLFVHQRHFGKVYYN